MPELCFKKDILKLNQKVYLSLHKSEKNTAHQFVVSNITHKHKESKTKYKESKTKYKKSTIKYNSLQLWGYNLCPKLLYFSNNWQNINETCIRY